MSNNFEYIDIILLAMIAGFIFLRLRGILGKKTGFTVKSSLNFDKEFSKNILNKDIKKDTFDDIAQKNFLKGAEIAYEKIIIDFANGNLKSIKSLIDKKIYDQFNNAIKDREAKGQIFETTFIGISSTSIKDYKTRENIIEVTVEFVSEIISSIRDKEKNILSGDPEKVKKVYDTWKFLKDTTSSNPNWLLIETLS
jgi:predicted lipid-binding transport protein (Tim44 family)